ncbi:hypothetical protein HYV11_01290 [Candidatus Dependentiae bacterium]|nr:hypothetical protein [Candidatus Dependentiae bacterium]
MKIIKIMIALLALMSAHSFLDGYFANSSLNPALSQTILTPTSLIPSYYMNPKETLVSANVSDMPLTVNISRNAQPLTIPTMAVELNSSTIQAINSILYPQSSTVQPSVAYIYIKIRLIANVTPFETETPLEYDIEVRSQLGSSSPMTGIELKGEVGQLGFFDKKGQPFPLGYINTNFVGLPVYFTYVTSQNKKNIAQLTFQLDSIAGRYYVVFAFYPSSQKNSNVVGNIVTAASSESGDLATVIANGLMAAGFMGSSDWNNYICPALKQSPPAQISTTSFQQLSTTQVNSQQIVNDIAKNMGLSGVGCTLSIQSQQ